MAAIFTLFNAAQFPGTLSKYATGVHRTQHAQPIAKFAQFTYRFGRQLSDDSCGLCCKYAHEM